MDKIAIYYIATNKYINFFSGFLSGVEKFYPGVNKEIVLITDCDDVDFSKRGDGMVEIRQVHIDHHFWPIPTLFKMFYMDKFFSEDCDQHFYCNANMKFEKEFDFGDSFDLHLTKHYLSDRLSLISINNGNCNNCIMPPSWAKCHISTDEVPRDAVYCQGGFFGGKTDKVRSLLNDINSMLKEDLKHNIIPVWHDETYLNKYLLKNYWNVNRIGNVNIISIYDYANLLDKNDYFDKFRL